MVDSREREIQTASNKTASPLFVFGWFSTSTQRLTVDSEELEVQTASNRTASPLSAFGWFLIAVAISFIRQPSLKASLLNLSSRNSCNTRRYVGKTHCCHCPCQSLCLRYEKVHLHIANEATIMKQCEEPSLWPTFIARETEKVLSRTSLP
jgi:hypothetical protein